MSASQRTSTDIEGCWPNVLGKSQRKGSRGCVNLHCRVSKLMESTFQLIAVRSLYGLTLPLFLTKLSASGSLRLCIYSSIYLSTPWEYSSCSIHVSHQEATNHNAHSNHAASFPASTPCSWVPLPGGASPLILKTHLMATSQKSMRWDETSSFCNFHSNCVQTSPSPCIQLCLII